MRKTSWFVFLYFLLVLSVKSFAAPGESNWCGVHLWIDSDGAARELIQTIPKLAEAGANALVLEINYSYEFQRHPELRERRFVRGATAHALASTARKYGITLIPEFNCLGHQSFGHRKSPLLRIHSEFNETPSLSVTNTNVYCLSWCPNAPGLSDIVFSLIDEIADGFEARSIHVGMDEVYLIASDECPRCRGLKAADVFASQVKSLHEHIVNTRGLQMMMWADRVIGTKYQGASQYDDSHNDSSAAISSLPRDVVLCDWHYEKRAAYPSINYLAQLGYHVWPASFKPVSAAQALSDYAWNNRSNVMGFLTTTWNSTKISDAPEWPPIKDILPRWHAEHQTAP